MSLNWYSLLPKLGLFALPLVVAGLAYSVATIVRILPEQRRLVWALVAGGIALLAVVGFLVVRWARARMKAGKLEAGLSSGGGADRKGEIEALRKNWRESLAKLRGTAVGGGGRRAISLLPWYVIIGAPASGKSTLLRQSGIDFPVGDAAIRGLQGTRNCDWWFSNVGVFLDTAGRYISDENAEEWAQFLDLVRRHRTQAPINGVIVAVPAKDLVEGTDDDRELEARRIRARLDELIDHLGVNFPVWVVVTKLDLVGGFVEFFGNADLATRQQMMGWTLDQDDGARYSPATFERRFAEMIHKLREMRPAMLAAAKLRDRPAAFGFPDEMAALAEPLGRMLQRMFEPNVYQETPLLRGVYITSATQQGTPLQRAAAKVREMLGAPAVDADAQGAVIKHAYFVKDLMHERIVVDHGMTWTTRHEIDRGKLKRLGINLIGSSVAVFLFLWFIAAGTTAASELDALEARIGSSKSGASAVARCDALWQAAELANDDPVKNLGLSQQSRLKQDLRARQERMYAEEVLGPIVDGYVTEIQDAPASAGIEEPVRAWRSLREVAAAIGKIAAAAAAPPAPPKAAKPGEPAAPPADPRSLPPELLSKAERDAFEARKPWFEKHGLLAPGDAEGVQTLLDVIWRNGGGAEVLGERTARVDAAIAAKAREWVAAAGEAVDRFERETQFQQETVDAWKAAFVEECDRIRRRLDTANERVGDLEADLDRMLRSASGPADAGSGGPGGAGGASALLRTIAAGRKALEDSAGPVPAAELAGFQGWPAVVRWSSTETKPSDPKDGSDPKPAATGTPAEARAALLEIAGALADFERERQAGTLVRHPWNEIQTAPNLAAALGVVAVEADTHEKAWVARVAGPLGRLKRPERAGAPDDESWRRAVETVPPALRRNRIFEWFMRENDRGTFDDLSRKVVERRRKTFDRTELRDDLKMLVEPLDFARSKPGIAGELAELARDRVETAFDEIVKLARTRWDKRIEELPLYRDDPWGYLARWVEPTGSCQQFVNEIKSAWADAEFDDQSRAADDARAVWARTDELRKRYRFFLSLWDAAKPRFESIMKYADGVTAANLRSLASDMGAVPKWDPVAAFRGIETSEVDGPARTALRKAVLAAEDEICANAARQFNNAWEPVRRQLAQSLRDPGSDAIRDATGKLSDFERDLALFFGAALSEKPGGRLRVTMAYHAAREAVTNSREARALSTQPVTIQLDCRRVPSKQAEKFPAIEVDYQEGGRERQRCVWKPGQGPQSLVFTPGRGQALRIAMRSDRNEEREEFASWIGSACFVDALRAGGGAVSELHFKGSGKYAGEEAVFILSASDPLALARLLQPETGVAPKDAVQAADKCVEVVDR